MNQPRPDPSVDLSGDPAIELATLDVGAVRLHVAQAGQRGRPLVVLLHGFPEFWWSWRYQLPALAAAGFHAVAPDLRGYNRSDRPPRVRDYQLPLLESDIAGLVQALGASRAVVVGHDWGGVLAWSLAQHRSDLVERLVIINAPHPERLRVGLRRPAQLIASAYLLFFQLPWLPEWTLARDDFRRLRSLLARDGFGSPQGDEIQRYVDAARQGGNLRGGLAYYRAAGRRLLRGTTRPVRPIAAPTLIIWGQQDRFLLEHLAHPDPRLVPNARVELLAHASHWVQQQEPTRVNQLLIEFLRPLSPRP
jgi:pimeloyl-ACP methyl ester carboxylesterase